MEIFYPNWILQNFEEIQNACLPRLYPNWISQNFEEIQSACVPRLVPARRSLELATNLSFLVSHVCWRLRELSESECFFQVNETYINLTSASVSFCTALGPGPRPTATARRATATVEDNFYSPTFNLVWAYSLRLLIFCFHISLPVPE